MLVPLEWLKEFVDFSLTSKELASILTMAGLETTVEEEDILEIEITPNRGDCLSLLGVAREVSALVGVDLRMPPVEQEGSFEPDFKVMIDSPLCRRYAGRIIRGVRVGPSPDWIVRRLEACGLRSINNVVDITNYVLLEMGHPLHAFDLKTLRGNTIRVDTLREMTTFKTLDGVERQLPQGTLMIWDGERPVAVAGVMGGQETEVRDETRDIFLESAYFEPVSIRKTSKSLGLRTESSIRFERGTDIEGLLMALDRAAYLIGKIAGGEVSRRIDIYPYPKDRPEIDLRMEFLRAHLGISIEKYEVEDILRRLGFDIKDSREERLTVVVPTHRNDVSVEEDLVEEVARLKGYDSISSIIPSASVGGEGIKPERKTLNNIRQLLVNEGFFEVVNYSFIDPNHFDRLLLKKEDRRRHTVVLENPLSVQQSVMRTFLLPGLMDNLITNLTRGVREIRLFETGKVFFPAGNEGLPEEPIHLGGLLYLRKGQRLWQPGYEVFYQIKGVVEKVFCLLGIRDYRFKKADETFLHPGKSAYVYVDSIKVGFVGVLSPETKKAYDIESYREDIGVFELDLSYLLSLQEGKGPRRFTPLPRFPYIQRDISLLLPMDRTVEEALDLIKQFPEPYIEDSRVFDLYKGRAVPEGYRSVGISIVYRSRERTLTEEEVEAIHQRLVKTLMDRTGARLR